MKGKIMSKFLKKIDIGELSLEGEIKEISNNDAPVAIEVCNKGGMELIRGMGSFKAKDYYRYWKNCLFLPLRLNYFLSINGKKNRAAKVKDIYYHKMSFQYNEETILKEIKHFHEYLNDFVVIDGILHGKVEEPRWVVMTFGLGHNHGLGWGTSMEVEHDYNSNISRDRYFRIDQEKEANMLGRKIAEQRGDTKAFKHFDKRLYPHFNVYIPEALKVNPKKQHGKGDSFLNALDKMTMYSPSVAAAGAMAMAMALKNP
jgi:hypothetical protein